MPEETAVATVAEATEETAAPAASAEGTTATESATGEQQEPAAGEQQKPLKGNFQKRIDTLTRREAEARREAEFFRQMAMKGQPATPTTATETPKAEGKPDASKFTTHAEYVEALTDWKVDQKLKASEARQNAEKAQTHQKTVERTYQAKEQEYAASIPDFEETVAGADIPVSQAVIQEIVTGDNGPALKYYLAKNPDEAERLSQLSPVALAREVGRLESRFTKAPQKAAATVSGAPKPITPVSKSSATSTKDPGEMDLKEYRAWRAKQ